MTQVEARGGSSGKSAALNFGYPEFAEFGKKYLESIIRTQREMLERLEKSTSDWFSRAKSETDLASELANKLTTARSAPDAAYACQEWMNRWVEMVSEDSRRILADGAKLIRVSTEYLSNGSSRGRT